MVDNWKNHRVSNIKEKVGRKLQKKNSKCKSLKMKQF